MVVGTLNLESETELQFKVPTTMRRHEVMGAQAGSETGSRQGVRWGVMPPKCYNVRSPPPYGARGRHREQDRE